MDIGTIVYFDEEQPDENGQPVTVRGTVTAIVDEDGFVTVTWDDGTVTPDADPEFLRTIR